MRMLKLWNATEWLVHPHGLTSTVPALVDLLFCYLVWENLGGV